MKRLIKPISVFLLICLMPFSLVYCGKQEPTKTTSAGITTDNSITTTPVQTESESIPKSENTTVDTSTETDEVTSMDISTVFPKANQAKIIYLAKRPETNDDSLTAVTLQGLLAKNGDEQIVFGVKTADSNYIEILKTEYGVKVADASKSSFWNLVKKYAPTLDGYILTDIGDDSINVANSLSSLLNAVVVTDKNKEKAEECGLAMLIDVRDKNDSWLRKSEYWGKFNTKVAITTSVQDPFFLRDYAIVAGAYVFRSDDKTPPEVTARVDFLDDNFTVFGWHGIGEYTMVDTLSKVNGQLIPADWSYNLSTYSGFKLDYLSQKTAEASGEKLPKAGHTVVFVISDGDNLQWTQGDFTTSPRWFGNPLRSQESFNLGWGVPASLIDVAPTTLHYLYKNMTPKDNFMLQLSGIGYTFPSKWKNSAALDEMAAKVNTLMGRMDLNILEILDDEALTPQNVKAVYSKFLAQKNIDALFYINYHDYAKYLGKIYWINGKPVISAKYKLWATHETIDSIADKINKGSLDRKSPDAYTFVTVHAWSGLNDKGELVLDGNTVDAVKAVIEKLNPYVEVVTPEEFVRRIYEYNVGR